MASTGGLPEVTTIPSAKDLSNGPELQSAVKEGKDAAAKAARNKRACTNCRRAKLRCSSIRPCLRCVKANKASNCCDGPDNRRTIFKDFTAMANRTKTKKQPGDGSGVDLLRSSQQNPNKSAVHLPHPGFMNYPSHMRLPDYPQPSVTSRQRPNDNGSLSPVMSQVVPQMTVPIVSSQQPKFFQDTLQSLESQNNILKELLVTAYKELDTAKGNGNNNNSPPASPNHKSSSKVPSNFANFHGDSEVLSRWDITSGDGILIDCNEMWTTIFPDFGKGCKLSHALSRILLEEYRMEEIQALNEAALTYFFIHKVDLLEIWNIAEGLKVPVETTVEIKRSETGQPGLFEVHSVVHWDQPLPSEKEIKERYHRPLNFDIGMVRQIFQKNPNNNNSNSNSNVAGGNPIRSVFGALLTQLKVPVYLGNATVVSKPGAAPGQPASRRASITFYTADDPPDQTLPSHPYHALPMSSSGGSSSSSSGPYYFNFPSGASTSSSSSSSSAVVNPVSGSGSGGSFSFGGTELYRQRKPSMTCIYEDEVLQTAFGPASRTSFDFRSSFDFRASIPSLMDCLTAGSTAPIEPFNLDFNFF